MRFHTTALYAVGLAGGAMAVTIDMEGLPDTGLDTSSWSTGSLPPIADCVDLNDLQIAAKNTLSDADYAYYRTAALDEISKFHMFRLKTLHSSDGDQHIKRTYSSGRRSVSMASASSTFLMSSSTPAFWAMSSPRHSSLLLLHKLEEQAQEPRATW